MKSISNGGRIGLTEEWDRNSKAVTSILPAFWKRIEYLMEDGESWWRRGDAAIKKSPIKGLDFSLSCWPSAGPDLLVTVVVNVVAP
ncbi:hypothetical protein EVAR_37747_1 [Eumeta japonica]|uniref:Uncharacterized protein n=1 Tax=Eumeta variegata TaxID=151549 RepID=A0A4C1WNC5_EUMVA|nr:hypothetical protein EVAR_37747_1 [Eumeta japonica]